jgi:CelD/BcsL family acetyltransferase involved in cellulose biosynthesis
MLTTLSGSGIGDPGSFVDDRVVGSRIPHPGSRTDVVRDYDAFLALETEWNDAVERAQIPHPFLRHEWIRTWWDAFGPSPRTTRAGQGPELHIIVVRDEGRITGIAPLMRESTTVYGLPVRRLALLANDHTPRIDFVIAGNAAETYRAIWNHLREEIDRWDVLQLTQLQQSSPTMAMMSQLAAAEGLPTGTWRSSDSPYLELAGTWDGYWASLPAKFRSNVRNRLARLKQIGEPRLEVLTDKRAIADALAEAWRLEASGWKDQEGTSITANPAVQRFYTLLADRAVDQGWLRLLFLAVGDRRIAVSYSAVYDDRLFLIKTGHDREHHTCSPFKLLTWLAAQDGFARGLREIDFLGDTESWKQEWTPAARAHEWLFVFSHSRRARLLHSVKFQMAPEIRKWRA